MTTIAIAVMALVWIGISWYLQRYVRRKRAATLFALYQLAAQAEALKKSSTMQFEQLFAKIDLQTPRERVSHFPDTTIKEFIKISEAVVYTKHRVTTYYDPQSGIAVSSFDPPEFLATGIEIDAAQMQRILKLKERSAAVSIVTLGDKTRRTA